MAFQYDRQSHEVDLVDARSSELILEQTPALNLGRVFEKVRDMVDVLLPRTEPVNTRVPQTDHTPVQAVALQPKHVAKPMPAADVGHTPAHVPVHVPRAAMVPTPFAGA